MKTFMNFFEEQNGSIILSQQEIAAIRHILDDSPDWWSQASLPEIAHIGEIYKVVDIASFVKKCYTLGIGEGS